MMIRELRAKKAKYGFDLGYFSLHNVIELGKFFEALGTLFDRSRYDAEETGYGRPEIRVYTNDEEVAAWIRSNK